MEPLASTPQPIPLGRLNEGKSGDYLDDAPIGPGEWLRRGLLLVVVAALHLAGLQLLFRMDHPAKPRIRLPEMHVVLVEAERPAPTSKRSARQPENRRIKPVQAAVALTHATPSLALAPARAPVPAVAAQIAPPSEVASPPRQPAEQRAEAEPAPVPSKAVSPSWATRVTSWVQRHKRYPDLARTRHEQGDVCVRVTVTHDGSVVGTDLTCSSGSAVLDAAARDLFQSAHLPSFPRSMPQDEAVVNLVLSYSIGS